jgi:homeobox protein cut-like
VSAAQSLLRTAQLAIHHWKEVDLDEKRKGWEASTLEVANAQEASVGSRKALAESTKAFKKLDDAEKLAGWGALLKGYQGEVDGLTKRSKAAELAFLNMFKALRDIPSPVPMLTSLAEEVEKVVALKTAHDKVSKELAEYKEEFQSLKNQDVTIQRLKDKIASMEEERAEQVAAAVEGERKALEQVFVEKQEKEKSREKELQVQVKELKTQIAELNRKHDEQQSAAMENQAELERTLSARQSQIDLLSEEVDRLTGQVAAVEKEKEQINAQYLELWRKNYAQPSESTDAHTVSKVVELETALESREGRLKQLSLQVEILEEALQKERDTARRAFDEHVRALKAKEQEAEALKEKMGKLPTLGDYHALQRQLKILQAVEYNTLDTLDLDLGGAPSEAGGGEETRKLEEMLMAKNKQLESRLTEAKRACETAQADAKALQEELAALQRKSLEQGSLIAKLEEQLYQKDAGGAKDGRGFSAVHLSALLETEDHDQAQPHDRHVDAEDAEYSPLTPSRRAAAALQDAPNSLVSAVAEQRDRFRAANTALEAENAAIKKREAALDQETRTLRADNVKMYEKIKFLESYRPSLHSHAHTVDVEASIDTLPNSAKYKAIYEDSINPFTVFTQKQKALRKDKMDLPERIMLEVSQTFLGNKTARKFLFFYMIVMHFLVFVTLYRFTHNTGCRRVGGGTAAANAKAAAAAALHAPTVESGQKMLAADSHFAAGGGPAAAKEPKINNKLRLLVAGSALR